MESVGVTPVTYALYPLQPRKRLLRKLLVGGGATLALTAAALSGYLLHAPQGPGAALPGAALMTAGTGVVTADEGLGQPAVELPRLGPAGEPAAKDVVPTRAHEGLSPAAAPAAAKRSRQARRPAMAHAPAKPESATASIKPGKHEVSDAELQKILNGE
jgi:hypothetical protein